MYYTTAVGLKANTLKLLRSMISEQPDMDDYNGYEVYKFHNGFYSLVGFVDIKFHPSTMKSSVHISASRNCLPDMIKGKPLKQFNDLEFKKSHLRMPGTDREQAIMFFENGHGISVIKGFGAYGNKERPYECACIVKEGYGYTLSHEFILEWGDAVKGYCTKEEVTEIMKQIQNK